MRNPNDFGFYVASDHFIFPLYKVAHFEARANDVFKITHGEEECFVKVSDLWAALRLSMEKGSTSKHSETKQNGGVQ